MKFHEFLEKAVTGTQDGTIGLTVTEADYSKKELNGSTISEFRSSEYFERLADEEVTVHRHRSYPNGSEMYTFSLPGVNDVRLPNYLIVGEEA